MLRPLRNDGDYERMRRRHLPIVYRYALAVLPGDEDAHEVTRATFDRALELAGGNGRLVASRRWLVDTAHTLARARVGAEGDELAPPLDGGICAETERLLSRSLDGGVRRADRKRLREHLGRCEDCRARERSYRAVRRALRSLQAVPVPPTLLETEDRPPRFTSGGRRGSLASKEADARRGRPMGIVNRRNAVLGWAAWQVGKRVARRKAKSAVPSIDPESKRPNKSAIAAAVAALVGGLVFWKRQRDSGSSETSE